RLSAREPTGIRLWTAAGPGFDVLSVWRASDTAQLSIDSPRDVTAQPVARRFRRGFVPRCERGWEVRKRCNPGPGDAALATVRVWHRHHRRAAERSWRRWERSQIAAIPICSATRASLPATVL